MLLYLYQLKCASSATCVTRYFRSLQEASTGAIALCNCRLRSQCPRPFCCAALCYLWPYTHTHMGKCVCVRGCVHSPFVNKQRTRHTQGQARPGQARQAEASGHAKQTPPTCCFSSLLPILPLSPLCSPCTVLYCVCVPHSPRGQYSTGQTGRPGAIATELV